MRTACAIFLVVTGCGKVEKEGDGGGPPTCTEQYGSARAYEECEPLTDEGCRFFADLGGASCDEVCQHLGGLCTNAFPPSAGDSCASEGGWHCSGMGNGTICECTRGCGGGPACPDGEVCAGDEATASCEPE